MIRNAVGPSPRPSALTLPPVAEDGDALNSPASGTLRSLPGFAGGRLQQAAVSAIRTGSFGVSVALMKIAI